MMKTYSFPAPWTAAALVLAGCVLAVVPAAAQNNQQLRRVAENALERKITQDRGRTTQVTLQSFSVQAVNQNRRRLSGSALATAPRWSRSLRYTVVVNVNNDNVVSTDYDWTGDTGEGEGGGNAPVAQAKDSVRDKIRQEFGQSTQVEFDTEETFFVSVTQRGVRGRGRLTQRPSGAVQRFRYEARVRIPRGGVVSSSYELIDSGQSDALRVVSPRANEEVRTGRVPFQGTSGAADVRIEVFHRGFNSQRVALQTVAVRYGNWDTHVNLERGPYRAEIQALGRGGGVADRKTVNFEVTGVGEGGGLLISSPRNGEEIRGSEVRFEGQTEARDVRIQVYRGAERVADQSIAVRGGRWDTRIRLGKGSYRAVVQEIRRGGGVGRSETVRFEAGAGLIQPR